MTASRRAAGCFALSFALALGLLGIQAVTASAVTLGTPSALDAPNNGNAPLVAYAPGDGYAYVAWSAPANQNNGNGVDLCVLPPSQTTCLGGSPVLLTDTNTSSSGLGSNPSNTVGLGGLVILPGSGEVVVLGTPVQTGTVAWASPPGGAAFLTPGNGLQHSGDLISPVSLFYTINNAAPLNGTDVGLFDSYDHFFSFFSDSPYSGPETPATLPTDLCPTDTSAGPEGNANNCGNFDDQKLSTIGPVIAAEPAPSPAAAGKDVVVGVGANDGVNQNQTAPGCINSAATGFGTVVGTVGGGTGTPGSLNAQGLDPDGFSVLACSAQNPVLASGGTDGIGVLEEEGNGVDGAGSTYTLDYRPFDATATGGTFGAPVQLQDITSVSLGGSIDNLDASDDSAAGVYGSWQDEQGLVLDYSSNGGAAWDSPVIVPGVGSDEAPQGDPAIAGVSDGTLLLAYDADLGTGKQVFIQDINLLPPTPTTTATRQALVGVSGSNITIPAGTVGETDTATVSGTNAGIASGTMTYTLSSNSSCAAGDHVFMETTKVTDGVAAPATVTVGLAPGTYYWSASYSGDLANQASSSTCGSEVLTVTAPASTSSSATSTGTTITITVTCAGPCTVTVTITVDPPMAAADGHTARAKTVTLATGRYSSAKGGKGKLKLKLTPAGRILLRRHHGKLTAAIELRTKTLHGTFTTRGTLRIRR